MPDCQNFILQKCHMPKCQYAKMSLIGSEILKTSNTAQNPRMLQRREWQVQKEWHKVTIKWNDKK